MKQTKITRALARIEKTSRYWKRLYRLWWGLHYSIGIAGIVTAIIAGAGDKLAGSLLEGHIWVIGATSAICTALVTFLGPVQKADRYWRGFHKADQALLEYETGDLTIAKVAQAMKTARDIVLIGAESQPQEGGGTERKS